MKYYKEREEGKNRGVRMERSKAGTIKEVPTVYHYSKYNILINII